MSVNCKHWSDVGSSICGRCEIGLYGGTPSLGVCRNACAKREPIRPDDPPKPKAAAPAWLGHGVGSEVAKLIAAHGIKDKGCGSCEKMAGLWDSWGIAECERQADALKSTLIARAFARKWTGWVLGPAAILTAGGIVMQAIELAKADPLAKP